MSIVLESYERDFERFLSTANKLMNSFHLAEEAKKEMILLQIKKNLTDSESNLKKMEHEHAVLESNSKTTLQSKIKKFRSDLYETRNKAMKLEDSYLDRKTKQNLFGSRNEDNNKKDRLLGNTEKLLNQKDQFINMNKAAAETENVAITITGNLKYQRDLLLNAETSLKETHNDLSRTDHLISLMRNREIFNKIILIFLIIILTIANLVLLYVKVSSLFH